MIRALREVGWGYLLLFFPLLFVFILAVLEFLQDTKLPLSSAFIYPLLAFLVHQKRKDLIFMSKIPITITLLFVIEYNLLLAPVSIMLLIVKKGTLAIVGHLLLVVCSIWLTKQKLSRDSQKLNWTIPFLPLVLFEWRCMIRRYHFLFIALYLLGGVLALHYFVYQLFVLIMAGLIAATFKDLENKDILAQQPSLERKWLLNTLFISVLLIPHGIIFLLKSPDAFWVLLAFYGYLILYQTYCLFYKYAHYTPHRRATNNELATGFFIFLCPLLPVSLPMIAYYYWRAKNNRSLTYSVVRHKMI